MDDAAAVRTSAILRTLADLAPSNEQRAPGLAVPTEWFRWLPLDTVRLFEPGVYRDTVKAAPAAGAVEILPLVTVAQRVRAAADLRQTVDPPDRRRTERCTSALRTL